MTSAPRGLAGWKDAIRQMKPGACLINALSSAALAFGLYNVHALSGVTEGGVLGLTLLLDYWLNISPAFSGMVFNILCYLLGWKLLGKLFILYSAIGTAGFSIAYKICEQFDPVWPQLAEMPLAAAVVGAAFVGITVGLCVRTGGAPGGDDALAMSISHVTHIDIQWIYLCFDLIVLGASLSYIPLNRIAYSLLSVTISGQLVGFVQKFQMPKRHQKPPVA